MRMLVSNLFDIFKYLLHTKYYVSFKRPSLLQNFQVYEQVFKNYALPIWMIEGTLLRRPLEAIELVQIH